MSATWYGEAEPPAFHRLGLPDWMRALVKGSALGMIVCAGLLLIVPLRIGERLLCGVRRPVTPWIPVLAFRGALMIMGLKREVSGKVCGQAQAVVANHASWLDIIVLNSLAPVFFVSKAEVAQWPGIGFLARLIGTVFIARDRTQAAAQRETLRARLAAGHRLLFFPEGTSSDGLRVLPFKSTLFAALFETDLESVTVQPISLAYQVPSGQDPRFYSWWGDMEFGGHFLQVLAFGGGGSVTVTCHTSLAVADHPTRKDLAQACEVSVRAGQGASAAPPAQ